MLTKEVKLIPLPLAKLGFVLTWTALLVTPGNVSAQPDEEKKQKTDADKEEVSVDKAVNRAEKDIEKAKGKLLQTQERIRKQRKKKLKKLDDLKNTLADLRKHKQELTKERDALKTEEVELVERERHLENSANTVRKRLRRAFFRLRDKLTPLQKDAYSEECKWLRQKLNAKPDKSELPEILEKLVDVSLKTNAGLINPTPYPGEAVCRNGEVVKGKFLQLGPLGYFKSSSGKRNGVIIDYPEDERPPRIYTQFSDQKRNQIGKLFTAARAKVPVDPTKGDAIKLERARKTFVGHLRQGGVIVIPILLLGAFCLVVAVYKFITLRAIISRRPDEKISGILESLNVDDEKEATNETNKLPQPLRNVLYEGLRHRHADKEHLEEIMYEQTLAETPRLERFLSPLAVSASAAPLLGLLGTVTGMIHTFKLITVFGSGNAAVLAGGISEALVTTELGLSLAIPALLIHAYLSRRVRRAVALTQEASAMFVNGLKLPPSKT